MRPERNLNNYTRFVLPLVLNRFPAWKKLVRVVLEERISDSNGNKVIKITVPGVSGLDRNLVIETRRGELTVYFDNYHYHYLCNEPWSEQHVKKALDFVDDIFSERSGVITFFVDEKVIQSRVVELPGSAEVLNKEIVLDSSTQQRANRGTVRSWSGKFDMNLKREE